jgi:hypothetical protein
LDIPSGAWPFPPILDEAVLTDDDRRDPLPDERLLARILVHRTVTVRVDVHETRGHRQPTRVDLLGATSGDAPDLDDSGHR